MSTQQRSGVTRLNRVYEQYVKPVEHEHEGEYVLVRPDGQMIFAPSLPELLDRTDRMDDRNNCLFKVGEISVSNIL
jgi:hypothetical protein